MVYFIQLVALAHKCLVEEGNETERITARNIEKSIYVCAPVCLCVRQSGTESMHIRALFKL